MARRYSIWRKYGFAWVTAGFSDLHDPDNAEKVMAALERKYPK